jgi:hypothetical protein
MAIYRRMYGVFKNGKHLLLSTNLCCEKTPDSVIGIPRIIPSLIDPFLLWYSIRSRNDISAFTIHNDWLYLHLHDTGCLSEVEDLLHEPNETIKNEKIDALAKHIAMGLEEVQKFK